MTPMKQYQSEVKYLSALTTADADRLAKHGNPVFREHVAPILRQMAERHAHNDFTSAKDAQDCDAILFYASADTIRKAVAA